jgi:hypothetical protein
MIVYFTVCVHQNFSDVLVWWQSKCCIISVCLSTWLEVRYDYDVASYARYPTFQCSAKSECMCICSQVPFDAREHSLATTGEISRRSGLGVFTFFHASLRGVCEPKLIWGELSWDVYVIRDIVFGVHEARGDRKGSEAYEWVGLKRLSKLISALQRLLHACTKNSVDGKTS